MKIFIKFALVGVLLVIMLLTACDGGYGEDANLVDFTEVVFAEEEVNDENIPLGSVEEESVKALNPLEKFYGRWETEDQNGADKIILEMGIIDSEDVNYFDEEFDYIQFGFEDSGFFPRERIIEIEEMEAEKSYLITVSYVEESQEIDGWDVVETEKTEQYLIEFVNENKMLLIYKDEGEETEYIFYK